MRYARLPADIWTWPTFRALTDKQRLIAIYLWTGPHINHLGAFVIRTQTVHEHTGVSRRTCQRVLAEWTVEDPKKKVNLAHIWRGRGAVRAKWGLIWLPDYLEYLPPHNRHMWRAAAKSLEHLTHLAPPHCGLIRAITHNFETVRGTVPPNIKYNPPYSPPLARGGQCPNAQSARVALQEAAKTLKKRRSDSS